jgi:hypothetical protein
MSNKSDDLESVTNVAERASLRVGCARMIESSVHISQAFLSSHNWIAAPVESALHFSDSDAQSISKAASDRGIEYVFAVATEGIEESISCFKISMTSDGLLTFSKQCSHFNYILFPRNESFAILCTVDDYFLVAGPESFVADVVGMPVSDACRLFRDFADNSDWPAETRLHLLSVSDRYCPR